MSKRRNRKKRCIDQFASLFKELFEYINSLRKSFNDFFSWKELGSKRVGRYYKKVPGAYKLPNRIKGKKVDGWKLVNNPRNKKDRLFKPIFDKHPLFRKGNRIYWKGVPIDDESFGEDDPGDIEDYNEYVSRLNRRNRIKKRNAKTKTS